MTKRNLLFHWSRTFATLCQLLSESPPGNSRCTPRADALDDFRRFEVQLGAARILHRRELRFPDGGARQSIFSGTVVIGAHGER